MKKLLKLIVMGFLVSSQVYAGPMEQAIRLHNRLTGVPPNATVQTQMTNFIIQGQPELAAQLATNNPYFYNLRLKQWAKQWTNVDSSPRVPLNDMVATIIGMARDNVRFDQVLYGNIIYTGPDNIDGVPPYSPSDNEHYAAMEENRVDLFSNLTQRNQSSLNGISDTAGVLTSRAYGEAYFSAGTNRRVTRFTFINFMCKDFEDLHDITIPDFRVRRDVERNPGGDSRIFKNTCVGCHAGQDGLGGAFTYFNFVDGQLVHTPGLVQPKINLNNLYPDGHFTTDDSWINLWASGQNAYLGFRNTPLVGNGANSWGQMLAASRAFSECMAARAYKLTCLNDPTSPGHAPIIQSLADGFEAGANYNLKDLIVNASIQCLGE